MQDDPAGALDKLAAADSMLRRANAPLASYEAARLRARALAELDRATDAVAQAAAALAIAEQIGWPHRAEWIRSEFGLSAVPTGQATVSGSSSTASGAFRRSSGATTWPRGSRVAACRSSVRLR